MDSLVALPAFPAYAVSVSVLVITLYGLAFHTAATRAMRKVTLNAEDVTVAPGSAVVEFEHADVQRIKRAHQNLLENAAPFFVVGLLYCLTAPSLAFAYGLFGVFVGVRVLHAVFYLSAVQPFRTGSFAVGALVNLIMVVQVLRFVIPRLG